MITQKQKDYANVLAKKAGYTDMWDALYCRNDNGKNWSRSKWQTKADAADISMLIDALKKEV